MALHSFKPAPPKRAGFRIICDELNSDDFLETVGTTPEASALRNFNALGKEPVTPEQSLLDAERIVGVYSPLLVEMRSGLPSYTPMRFSPEDRAVQVNDSYPMGRAEAAQYMVEEIFHSIDVTRTRRSISSSSPLLDKGGIIREEAEVAFESGPLSAFWAYPFDPDLKFNEARITAELFARIGVLYFGDPSLLKEVMPNAYNAIHRIFQVSRPPVGDGSVRGKIWNGRVQSGDSETGGEYQPSAQAESALSGSDRQKRADRELGDIRRAIGGAFQGVASGRWANFGSLDTSRIDSTAEEIMSERLGMGAWSSDD